MWALSMCVSSSGEKFAQAFFYMCKKNQHSRGEQFFSLFSFVSSPLSCHATRCSPFSYVKKNNKKTPAREKAGASLDAANEAGLTPPELAMSLGNASLSRYLKVCKNLPMNARSVPLKRVSARTGPQKKYHFDTTCSRRILPMMLPVGG